MLFGVDNYSYKWCAFLFSLHILPMVILQRVQHETTILGTQVERYYAK
jgi:hypothetical protein